MSQENITTQSPENNSTKLFELYRSNLLQEENLVKVVESYCPEFGVSDQTTKIFERGTKTYPDKVKQAMIQIVKEYNEVFGSLVNAAKVDQEDYQYCDGKNNPTSLGLQIDMIALSDQVLEYCGQPQVSVDDIVGFLKNVTFEIENSLAAYTFLGALSPSFKQSLKSTLQSYRSKTNREIYLLATSE